MNTKVKVGFCVAYDWYLLQYALPLIYDSADTICLSIDVNRMSWAKNRYEFDEQAFATLIRSIDKDNKIILFEDNFHVSHLSPMENEVHQRNMMAEKMGVGGWHIQLDCDEYLLDFNKFTNYLRELSVRNTGKINICCKLVTLYKKADHGIFYITPAKKKQIEFIQIATNDPSYRYGRRNGNFNIYTNFNIIHQSWARSEQEISDKLNNWGHKNDFNAEEYISLWKSLNVSNYQSFHNFHPTEPSVWTSLDYAEGNSIESFIENFQGRKFNLSPFELTLRNSRTLARIKYLLNSL